MTNSQQPPKRKRHSLIIAIALVLGGALAVNPVMQLVDSVVSRFTVEDYVGQGEGTVVIVIEEV